MPSGPTHRRLTVLCSVVTLPAILLLPDWRFLALEAGVAVTLMPEFTPDLDTLIRGDSKSKLKDSVRRLLGLTAYSQLIPHRYGLGKRHWTRFRIWHIFMFSHIPGLGTLPRTAILLLPLALVLLAFSLNPLPILPYILFLWLGMSWSDTWHVVADILTTDFKVMKREYWYGRSTQGQPRKYPRVKRY